MQFISTELHAVVLYSVLCNARSERLHFYVSMLWKSRFDEGLEDKGPCSHQCVFVASGDA